MRSCYSLRLQPVLRSGELPQLRLTCDARGPLLAGGDGPVTVVRGGRTSTGPWLQPLRLLDGDWILAGGSLLVVRIRARQATLTQPTRGSHGTVSLALGSFLALAACGGEERCVVPAAMTANACTAPGQREASPVSWTGRLSGRVSRPPADVRALRDGAARWTHADEDGSFVIDDLSPGEWIVTGHHGERGAHEDTDEVRAGVVAGQTTAIEVGNWLEAPATAGKIDMRRVHTDPRVRDDELDTLGVNALGGLGGM